MRGTKRNDEIDQSNLRSLDFHESKCKLVQASAVASPYLFQSRAYPVSEQQVIILGLCSLYEVIRRSGSPGESHGPDIFPGPVELNFASVR